MMPRRTILCLLFGATCCTSFSVTRHHCRRRSYPSSLQERLREEDYWEDEDPFHEVHDEDDYQSNKEVDFGTYEEESLEWEEFDDNTWVLLPPSYVSKPTAILHFVGGTFFGSSPKDWYGTLLEGLVRATQCTIVATAIPVTLVENPLQHVTLSRKVQRLFQSAYVDVLEDEFGGTGILQDVPVVAVGHSLGARLLAVLATLAPPKNAAAPPYKNYIFLSFTNYGASASIPGVQQLVKSRHQLNNMEEPTATTTASSREPRRGRRRRPRRRGDEWDEWAYFEEEEDLEEMLDDLSDMVKVQTSRVRDAVTPLAQELEFYPSPEQLWDALTKDQRYSVPETLIVQFDEDEVDQSAQLARCLTNSTDLKYALLKGDHLAPVDAKEGSWMEQASKATKILWQKVAGKKSPSRKKMASQNMLDLRQSIARYITDVATK